MAIEVAKLRIEVDALLESNSGRALEIRRKSTIILESKSNVANQQLN
jgi:hypothetical protein